MRTVIYNMEIYIRPSKKILVEQRNIIYLKDICEIVAPENICHDLGNRRILTIDDKSLKQNYLVTITDIIKVIKKNYPDHSVVNIGESDTVIEYSPEVIKQNKFLNAIKIIFVCIVLFMGAASAIMSFHSDAEIPDVFRDYYEIFFGHKIKNPKIIAIPYSIGLSAGIIIFFNHVGGKKITNDPTPIEVEMSVYSQDIYDTLVDSIKTDKQNSKKNMGENQ